MKTQTEELEWAAHPMDLERDGARAFPEVFQHVTYVKKNGADHLDDCCSASHPSGARRLRDFQTCLPSGFAPSEAYACAPECVGDCTPAVFMTSGRRGCQMLTATCDHTFCALHDRELRMSTYAPVRDRVGTLRQGAFVPWRAGIPGDKP